MGPTGFVAVLAGWITTEVGRQPFTVYGLLRTSESLAPIEAPAVATSLIAFIVVYFFVFGAGTWYIVAMMRKPVVDHVLEDERDAAQDDAAQDDGPILAVGEEAAVKDKAVKNKRGDS